MSDSNRIFSDISECDRACGRVCLRKLVVPVGPTVYVGVVSRAGGGKAEPDEPVGENFAPRVPPLCGPAGAAVL